MDIKIQIEGDRVKSVSKKELVTGNVMSYKLIFEFDSAWDNLIKLAVFQQGEAYYSARINDDNTAYIPLQVLSNEGTVYIGAVGIDREEEPTKRISTQPKLLYVHSGSYSEEMAEAQISNMPTLWDEYIATIEGYVQKAKTYTTPYIGEDGSWYIWNDAEGVYENSGKPSRGEKGDKGDTGNDGYTPVKGIDYFDGNDGQDGVSCTHSWDGTILTVTSASGTSSADLKGEKGDKGETGAQGEKGEKGDKGDGADIVIDAEMSDTSTNPVQNKVVKEYVDSGLLPKIGYWSPQRDYKAGELALGSFIASGDYAKQTYIMSCIADHSNGTVSGLWGNPVYDSTLTYYWYYEPILNQYEGKDANGNVIHNTYVKKEDGKGLAQIWDYPLSDGASMKIIEVITSDGQQQQAALPAYTSTLINDSGFITQTELDEQIGDIETALDNIIALQNDSSGGDDGWL